MELPDVDAVRPSVCPCCGQPSRPLGGALQIVGHGTRFRMVRGVIEADTAPTATRVRTRRYRCRGCGAVLVVVPVGVLPRRRYGLFTLLVALAAFGLERRSLSAIRAQVAHPAVAGHAARGGWHALRRWCHAVRDGRLLPQVRGPPVASSLRQIAERAASTALAWAVPTLSTTSMPTRLCAAMEHLG